MYNMTNVFKGVYEMKKYALLLGIPCVCEALCMNLTYKADDEIIRWSHNMRKQTGCQQTFCMLYNAYKSRSLTIEDVSNFLAVYDKVKMFEHEISGKKIEEERKIVLSSLCKSLTSAYKNASEVNQDVRNAYNSFINSLQPSS